MTETLAWPSSVRTTRALVLAGRGHSRAVSVAVRLVVEPEVVLWHEAETIRTGVSEGANPITFVCEATDQRAALCTQMPWFYSLEFIDNPVDSEILIPLEFIQVLVVDLHLRIQWFW